MSVYWLWLAARPGLGPVKLRRLLEQFGSPKALYDASEETLLREGVPQAARARLADKALESARAVLRRCEALDIRVLTLYEADYPAALRQMENAPPVLYCKGRLPRAGLQPWIGVVGAREADALGFATARRLGWQLSACGGLVVTGMAKGVDAEAARGALEQGGCVVGVLGCGVDVVYPRENQALFAQVQSQGCLLSEYPPGVRPNARNFPARNRIISALSDGVVVVQAAENSGALITARWAQEQGRAVFAVPGPAGAALSQGCNRLLREGAILTETGWDVLQEYLYRYPDAVRRDCSAPPPDGGRVQSAAPRPPSAARTAKIRPFGQGAARLPALRTPLQREIYESLQDGPVQLDALIDRLGCSAAEVLPELTMLQISRVIEQRPGKIYALLSDGDSSDR